MFLEPRVDSRHGDPMLFEDLSPRELCGGEMGGEEIRDEVSDGDES